MFTGLIEAIGIIKDIRRSRNSYLIKLTYPREWNDIKIGDSISVDGICLTLVDVQSNYFVAEAMPETVKNTCAEFWKPYTEVNLERALTINGRLDGHLVTGHIDGIGQIDSITKDEIAYKVQISCSEECLKYIVHKGSITVNGISLTVSAKNDNSFEVSIIPHTYINTNCKNLRIGSFVNLETDIIGKYVYSFIHNINTNNQTGNIMKILAQSGFLEKEG